MLKLRDNVLQYGIFFLLIGTLLVSSCGEPVGGKGKTPVFLSVQSPDVYGVVSDVYTPGVPGNVTRDDATAVIKSIYKDPTGYTATDFADILLTEQRVQYFRYDGDPEVPEPFIITLPNNLVPAGGELELGFIIIRAGAKLESPLKDLAFGGGEGEIYMSALVEFFGEDLAGNAAYGNVVIPIWAADY